MKAVFSHLEIVIGKGVRNGFTIVELCVVVLLLILLVALILPAVLHARAYADRLACSNNLRTLGNAITLYHTSHKVLPKGCSYSGPDEPFPHMSWLTRLLPYIENDITYNKAVSAYSINKFFLSTPHHAILSTVIDRYVCPSDPRLSAAKIQDNVLGGKILMAFTSYLGVSGKDQLSHDGVLFLNSQIRFNDIHDGLSNTLMVGERPPSALMNAGWWYAGWGMSQTGSGDMHLGVNEINTYKQGYPSGKQYPKGPYNFTKGDLDNQADMFHFWSMHLGGGHFLFCDSSVRFLKYDSNKILLPLATRDGKEVVRIIDE